MRMANPFRTFSHPDGRRWHVRQTGVALELELWSGDGEKVERSRRYGDGDEAAAAVAKLIQEQLADGFVETSAAPWQRFLDELVQRWRQFAPDFDAEALRQQLLASTAPTPRELVEAVIQLGDRWVAQKDGSSVLAYGADCESARLWLLRQLPGSTPALVLALRHPDHGAQLRVEAMLGEARVVAALPGLLSVLRHPGASGQHLPSWALNQLGAVTEQSAAGLIDLLDDPAFAVAGAAAKLLAEHASTERLLVALLERRERAEAEDDYAWALMRAAEVSKDARLRPHLEWMLKSGRFRTAGYPERIRAALAGLKTPLGAA